MNDHASILCSLFGLLEDAPEMSEEGIETQFRMITGSRAESIRREWEELSEADHMIWRLKHGAVCVFDAAGISPEAMSHEEAYTYAMHEWEERSRSATLDLARVVYP